jgi:LTXXQ motif family protein
MPKTDFLATSPGSRALKTAKYERYCRLRASALAVSSTCQCNALNRLFSRLRNSEAPSTISRKLRKMLPTNYGRPVPLSPVARIDTVATRLRAMVDAIKSIRPVLENFYASLNDEQKARFNMMGPPPQRG